MRFAKWMGLGALAWALAGCDRTPTVREFQARGTVKSLDADGKTVTIQHEAISNYMAAMTMPFEVHDTNLLHAVKTGDRVAFQLDVTEMEGWIEKLSVVAHAAPESANTSTNAPKFKVSRAVEPLDEGQTLPDYQFTNELGKGIRLTDYKGQVFAFTFFFTSCPYPNFCPRITSDFSQVAQQLARATNAPGRWHLFSISFDPRTDVPAHLLNYAQAHEYDAAHWSFLTGAEDQITELADNVGENFWTESNSISHNIRTVVIGKDFRVKKILVGSNWSPSEVGDAMKVAGDGK